MFSQVIYNANDFKHHFSMISITFHRINHIENDLKIILYHFSFLTYSGPQGQASGPGLRAASQGRASGPGPQGQASGPGLRTNGPKKQVCKSTDTFHNNVSNLRFVDDQNLMFLTVLHMTSPCFSIMKIHGLI